MVLSSKAEDTSHIESLMRSQPGSQLKILCMERLPDSYQYTRDISSYIRGVITADSAHPAAADVLPEYVLDKLSVEDVTRVASHVIQRAADTTTALLEKLSSGNLSISTPAHQSIKLMAVNLLSAGAGNNYQVIITLNSRYS